VIFLTTSPLPACGHLTDLDFLRQYPIGFDHLLVTKLDRELFFGSNDSSAREMICRKCPINNINRRCFCIGRGRGEGFILKITSEEPMKIFATIISWPTQWCQKDAKKVPYKSCDTVPITFTAFRYTVPKYLIKNKNKKQKAIEVRYKKKINLWQVSLLFLLK
jgi:hypothetical protein